MPFLESIGEIEHTPLKDLFEADEARVERLCLTVAGVHFDWSKTHLTPALVELFGTAARAADLDAEREALFSGDVVNATEGRAAEHTAERGEGAVGSVARAARNHARMRELIESIESGAYGTIDSILHLGIGGSALGPDLLVDALGSGARYKFAAVSNVDGVALERAFSRLDPKTTLVVVASKTFTTTETLLNAASARQWLSDGGVSDPTTRLIAVTAAPGRAIEWGADPARVLPFAETVGGRYSLWSSVGFAAALTLGWANFLDLLRGSAEMDRHFRTAPIERNAPALAAFADLLYTQARGCETRATFVYDERLRLLPSYLQQLEMESNGKSVTKAGEPVRRPTAPITWGGVGTDAQHAVFQLLHQGTRLVPVEFVGVIEAGDALDSAHHRQLLTNMLAQGAALMAGRSHHSLALAYPGDRPSSTLLLDRLDAHSLGALIAFYEHRTFVNAVLLGINPFDQFGVELGKEMARAAEAGDAAFDRSTQALLDRIAARPAQQSGLPAVRLRPRRVAKPWGRRDLIPPFSRPGESGMSIGEIWFEAPADEDLPLLIKFLFTSEKLSIQVHPSDDDAATLGERRGKEEAWLILDAEPGAVIGLGLRESADADAVRAAALDGSLEAMLDWRPVSAGDFFHIPAGTIHALGGGLVLVEIQQNSDLTYRLFDYGRPRELHLDRGLAVSHLAPYGEQAVRGPGDPTGREILTARGRFVIERWQGERVGGLDATRARPTWLIPLRGETYIGDSLAEPGEVWLAEAPVRVRSMSDSVLLVAYPGQELLGLSGG